MDARNKDSGLEQPTQALKTYNGSFPSTLGSRNAECLQCGMWTRQEAAANGLLISDLVAIPGAGGPATFVGTPIYTPSNDADSGLILYAPRQSP